MGMQEKDPLARLSLPPGFRFYPTDEELLVQYLCRKVAGHNFSIQIIAEIDLYKFDPWVLPSKAMFGEKEWYFFSPRDRKYPNGSRPNRVAGTGYWKATGTDKMITTQGKRVGIKKALVFYVGKAPKGSKTNWIMHEYRLTEPTRKMGSTRLDDWVLCRIYKKNSGGSSNSKPMLKNEHSTGGSSSSLSDDVVLETLPDNKFSGLQHLGSGSFDWSVLAELGSTSGLLTTQPQLPQANTVQNDIFAPSMAHVESSHVDGEVQSGVRIRPVGGSNPGYYNPNSGGLTQSYSNSVGPFEVRYTNQQLSRLGFGFGYRQ